jgi:hypothetical protein
MPAYRLFVTGTTLGALNLYSTQPDAFSVEDEDEGLLFADHAAVALVGAQTRPGSPRRPPYTEQHRLQSDDLPGV